MLCSPPDGDHAGFRLRLLGGTSSRVGRVVWFETDSETGLTDFLIPFFRSID